MLKPALAVDIDKTFPLAPLFPDLGTVVSMLVKNALLLAGLIFFFVLIFSGLKYILSGGNKENIQKAGAGITNALLGLIIVFVSYWAIVILEIITGLNILKPTI
jgi:hypothetical protein